MQSSETDELDRIIEDYKDPSELGLSDYGLKQAIQAYIDRNYISKQRVVEELGTNDELRRDMLPHVYSWLKAKNQLRDHVKKALGLAEKPE